MTLRVASWKFSSPQERESDRSDHAHRLSATNWEFVGVAARTWPGSRADFSRGTHTVRYRWRSGRQTCLSTTSIHRGDRAGKREEGSEVESAHRVNERGRRQPARSMKDRAGNCLECCPLRKCKIYSRARASFIVLKGTCRYNQFLFVQQLHSVAHVKDRWLVYVIKFIRVHTFIIFQ